MQVGRYCLTCDSETYTLSQLARLFGCSERTIHDWIVMPRDPRTRKPAIDPETGDSILGCAVTRVGRETVIAAEDLKLWMRQHARPVKSEPKHKDKK